MKAWSCPIGAALLLAPGCGSNGPDPRSDDSPTFGQVLILADEDVRPVIAAEERVFEALYRDAQLDIRYLPEAELLKAILNDSVRCAIMTVAPGADQQAYFDKRRLSAPSVPIYTDGIAVVVNKDCTSRPPTVNDLRTLLSRDHDKSIRWSPCSGSNALPIALFPSTGSGVARWLADSLFDGKAELAGHAVANVDSVVSTVARDPRAVGFIPFAAISDLDDPHMRALRDQVKLLAISRSDSTPAVLPSQGTLADGRYPLRRTVRMVLTEGKSGLGTGFVSFVANHKGQRIILKLGVAPIKVPAREVEIVHE